MRVRNIKAANREITLNGSAILASIKGTVKNNSTAYRAARVYAIEKVTRRIIPIKIQQDGSYVLKGVVRNAKFIIIAEDLLQQFNAVIQDNVVPK